MKRLLSCLLAAALLFSLTINVSADTFTDDEKSGETISADEKVEDTDFDSSAPLETEPPSQVEVVPNVAALPEGYEIDPDFSIKITLDAEHGWSYNLKDLLDEVGDDEYIYFVTEEDVAEGYTPFYALSNSDFSKNSPLAPSGNLIIVKNVREGEPPVYELPKTGGIGTTPYTVAGTSILLIAAVYGMILHYKRRKSA